LNHPNIVKLYEVIDDEEDEKIHLIMNYCKHGEILSFDEDKMKFTPTSALT
jgi:[calcium/calmodulin-dependent protein kinase] kinase